MSNEIKMSIDNDRKRLENLIKQIFSNEYLNHNFKDLICYNNKYLCLIIKNNWRSSL